MNDDIVEKYNKKIVKMKVGQWVVFNSKLIHRSGINSSGKVRYSLVGMYHDAKNPDFNSYTINLESKTESPREFFNKIMGK